MDRTEPTRPNKGGRAYRDGYLNAAIGATLVGIVFLAHAIFSQENLALPLICSWVVPGALLFTGWRANTRKVRISNLLGESIDVIKDRARAEWREQYPEHGNVPLRVACRNVREIETSDGLPIFTAGSVVVTGHLTKD